MDLLGSPSSHSKAAMVFMILLQTGCRNPEFKKELFELSRELNVNWDDVAKFHALLDGDLESDGHLPCSTRDCVGDIHPVAELHWPGNHGNAEAVQEVAAGLREIADHFDYSAVNRSTQNLLRELLASPFHLWQEHLTREVQWVLGHGVGVGLEQLPQERVLAALTLTLLKGVCEQVPCLLRHLFMAALQYINSVMDR
ncbi:BH3 interacting domain death agonist [Thalassophryne amazonica]|uniref:BH3 interacting domain death agonist n=1 Tax=Thalassophryne amazonica TaxID=390379 RepID=UPI0014726A32|nr:BH3 interacting domain death agonist [Thalassophryne amazonica]